MGDLRGDAGGASRRGARRPPSPVFLAASAVLVFVVVVLRFTPQVVLWRGLDAHAGWFTPELNRAAQTLRQIQDPWSTVENEVNAVLNWRLLFPLLAHYTRMPQGLFLALPAVGCLLTLALLTSVFAAAIGDRWTAVAATALMATTSWFLTSTGWLAYFDSWYVGGLLLAAFLDSRGVLAITCLLVPWVDERFLLGLPLALAVRAVRRAGGAPRPSEALADVAACAGGLAPFAAIRLGAMLFGSDAATLTYARKHLFGQAHFPDDPRVFVSGSWHGLRAAWVYVAAFVVLAIPRGRRGWAVVVPVLVLATCLLALFTAADISRSMSLMLPAAAMGVILVARRAPRVAAPLLGAALACNLLAPAAHVNAAFEARIGHVFAALEAAAHPPSFLDPAALTRAGVEHFARGELQDAFFAFDSAVRLDPGFAEALHNRGRAAQELGDLHRARDDFAAALALMPGDAPSHSHTARRLQEVETALAAPAPASEP